MISENVSLEHDELLDDQDGYNQSRLEDINSQYLELFTEYKDSRGNLIMETSWPVFNMAQSEDEKGNMEEESVHTHSTSS